MTDTASDLLKGQEQLVRHGPKPVDGWKRVTPPRVLADGDAHTYRAPGTGTPPPPPPPDEEPPPPPSTGAVGYGKSAKGGTKDAPVRTLTELVAACGHPDNRVLLQNPIDLGGRAIALTTATTLEGKGEATMLGNGWLQLVGDDVVVRNVAAWCGDEKVSVDADTLNANGSPSNPVERLLVDHCLFLWGIDVTFVLLNAVIDATVQHTVVAEGLYLSKHSEATAAQGGHSMSFNCTDIGTGTAPKRITFYRNGFLNSADRNGRFMGAMQVDLIENLLYGWKKPLGFHGAPKDGLNVVNNLIRSGSQSAQIAPFTPATSGDVPNLTSSTVYVAGNVADGFAFKSVSSPIFRNDAKHPLSVASTKAPTLDEALAWLGPPPMGKQVQRLAADVRARASVYVNGVGKGGKEYRSLL